MMRSHTAHVEYDFAKPVDRVFAYLSEHENLETVFPARITRLSDGDDGQRNGVGSSRKLNVGPLPPFVETVTQFVPGEKIEYKITKGSPLRNHVGTLLFSATPGGGTRVDYKIRLAAPLPFVALIVKLALTDSIRKGFKKVDVAA